MKHSFASKIMWRTINVNLTHSSAMVTQSAISKPKESERKKSTTERKSTIVVPNRVSAKRLSKITINLCWAFFSHHHIVSMDMPKMHVAVASTYFGPSHSQLMAHKNHGKQLIVSEIKAVFSSSSSSSASFFPFGFVCRACSIRCVFFFTSSL